MPNLIKEKNIMIVIILILQISIALFFSYHREGLYADELWSYAFSNGYYISTSYDTNGLFYQWVSNSFWHDLFTVQESQTFSYDSVLYSQRYDISPPLHSFVLHSICSLFPDVFSRWFGVFVNIVFFLFTQIILFKIGNLLFKNQNISIFLITIYGFTWGAINCLVYIRMYMMLAFFVIFSYYLHLKLLTYIVSNIYVSKKTIYSYIIGVTYFGVMTHLYFLLYTFYMALFFLKHLYFELRDMKTFLQYAFVMLFSVFLSVMTYPHIIEVLSGKGGADYFIRNNSILWIKKYLDIINMDVFGNNFLLFIIACITTYLFYNFIFTDDLLEENIFSLPKMENKIILFTICVVLCYIGTISLVAPFITNRYLYAIYPIIAVIIIYMLQSIMVRKSMIFSIVFLIACNFSHYKLQNLLFPEIGYNKINEILKVYPNSYDAIVVQDWTGWWPLIWRGQILMNTNNSYLTTIDRVDNSIIDIKNSYYKPKKIILMISDTIDENHYTVLNKFVNGLKINFDKEVKIDGGSAFILVVRN